MNKEILKKIVVEAVHRLIQKDCYLFKVNSSERSMTHRLAMYIEVHPSFDKSYNVDCEYNRNGEFSKSVAWRPNSDESSVYPDIVVHRRGQDGPNLLIIEAKKSIADIQQDVLKLKAYINDLDYQLGLCVVLEEKPLSQLHLEWFERT